MYLPNVENRPQFTANGSTNVFNFSFFCKQNYDMSYTLRAYVTLSGSAVNEDTDIQEQGVAYTVQLTALPSSGGTITFQSGHTPPANSTVTIESYSQPTINTNYSAEINIDGQNMDDDFATLMSVAQQSYMQFSELCLRLNINSKFSNIVQDLPNGGYTWVGLNGKAIAAKIMSSDSTLRSELSSEADGADGASMIGYYDERTSTPETIGNFLNNLRPYMDQYLRPTGEISWGGPFTRPGWVRLDNGTIGNAASGASYANANTFDLFGYIWTMYAQTECEVSGGRGANYTADFNANKTIRLPQAGNSSFKNFFSINTDLFPRVGSIYGEDEVILTGANMADHVHGSSSGQGFIDKDGNGPYNIGTGGFVASQGSTTGVISGQKGQAHNNIQPSIALYCHIKL